MKTSLAIILLSLVTLFQCPFVESVKISGFRTSSSSSSSTIEDPSNNSKEAVQGVITLNSRNFQSSINDGNVWLVEFYSPWCGHCKRFAQTYESIAAHLHSTTSIKVAKVDGSIERALSSRFNIKGYPSFFLVSGWDIYEYNQPRTKNKMIQFALQKDDGMEPMSFITSPFGPFGMTRGFIISTGTRILDLFEYLVQEKGLGKTFAAVIMASVGIFFGTIFVILVGLALVPKPKVD